MRASAILPLGSFLSGVLLSCAGSSPRAGALFPQEAVPADQPQGEGPGGKAVPFAAPASFALSRATEIPAVSGPLTLEEVLRLSIERSLEIALAREMRREAAAVRDTAFRSLLPTLQVGVGAARYDGRIQSTEGVFEEVHKQQFFGDGGVALEIRPGEAVFETQAAFQRQREAKFRVEAARLTARFESAAAFFSLQRAYAQARIVEETLTHARALVEWTRSRVELGATLQAALGRARAEEAAEENRLAEARQRILQTSLRLGRLLHLSGPHPLEVAEVRDSVPDAGEEPDSLEDLFRNGFAGRPDVRAAGASMAAARRELSGSRNAWMIPSLQLAASGGGLGGSVGGLQDREIYTAALQWEVGFDQFSRVRRQESRLRQEELRFSMLRDAVRAEIGAALAALQSARARVKASGPEVEAAQEALELAETRFRNGAGLLLEVLDARGILSAAQSNQVRARLDLQEAALALRLATGRE
ncbi:MAG: TolC family protein [Planctomycetota bacterium]